ncbi:MAG: KH domain-containing protein, partial [Nanoarchaeota archaeon]|nr:KH domain-containing protein [Nanoarchaeota archaeon]
MAENIINEVLKHLPKEKISDACFEGANIVLYTKDRDFFLNNNGLIREVVDAIKKRVELRPDPSISMDLEEAEKEIKKILPKEAGSSNIIFDSQRSMVIIEAEKPGLAIGKQGAVLREIREKTLYVPLIRRTPAIKSKLIENTRAVLYQNSDYRRKFLDKIGHRIYDGWVSGKKKEWIRISFLGGGRQVGRSCLFLQTPESRVLLDCGVNIANDAEAYPYLEAPEFDI